VPAAYLFLLTFHILVSMKRILPLPIGHWLKKYKKILLLGVVVIATAAVSLTVTHRHTNTHHTQPDSAPVTYSTDKPSEVQVKKDEYIWKGAADEPKYIELPSINGGGFIQKVGVDQHKQIAVPNNIFFAGWFSETVKPGQKGLSIIDGHVNGHENDGIFKNLGKLKVGDAFTVQLGDDSVKNYEVIKTVTVATADAPNELFSQDPMVISQLNVITCGGTFDRTIKQYDKRIIVSAKMVTK
jgi:LPXTG-site transpeptidase (sortase) family protein